MQDRKCRMVAVRGISKERVCIRIFTGFIIVLRKRSVICTTGMECQLSARTIEMSSFPVAIQSTEPCDVLGSSAGGSVGGGRCSSDSVGTVEWLLPGWSTIEEDGPQREEAKGGRQWSMVAGPSSGKSKRDRTHATSIHGKSFVRPEAGRGRVRLTPHLTLLVQGAWDRPRQRHQ